MPTTTWYGDESYYFRDGKGWYFVGLASPLGDPAEARAALAGLVLRPGGQLHFYEEDHDRRLLLARAVRDLGFRTAVVVWQGEATAGRARATCLKAAARELHGDVTGLVLESIDPRSDARDARGLARMYPTAYRVPVDFVDKRSEPLVWVPDIVAGAAHQAYRRGHEQYLDALGDSLVIEAT